MLLLFVMVSAPSTLVSFSSFVSDSVLPFSSSYSSSEDLPPSVIFSSFMVFVSIFSFWFYGVLIFARELDRFSLLLLFFFVFFELLEEPSLLSSSLIMVCCLPRVRSLYD